LTVTENVLRNFDLKGVLGRERAYGETIDNLLVRYESDANIDRIEMEVTNILELLLLKRIDFTIDYSEVFHYTSKSYARGNNIISLPIIEETSIKKVYLACPKTEWGKQVINRINQILAEIKTEEEWIKIVAESWLDEKARINSREAYNQIILNQ